MFGLYIHIYALPFFKMDSSSECGTKLDFSNESIPPPPIKTTVSVPVVIEIKKADTKCFDSKWPFEDYRSRLSEAEILIFENKKEFSMGQVVGDLSSIWSSRFNQLCLYYVRLLMYVYFDVTPPINYYLLFNL